MVPQISTVFYNMSLNLEILAIKTLIVPHGVSCHLIWPFEEWLILNLLQNMMHRLPEHRVNRLSIGRPWLPSKVPPRSVVVVSVRLEIPYLLRDNLNLSFPLLLVFLNPLVLINPVYELVHTGDRFAIRDFLKLCLAGRPTLKVLMATSLKSPSISLNISQYLSEYVFRVSSSRMDKDSRESKGWGTLLHVIKWEPNAQVSFLKESMESALRSLNHFIATDPRLDGNTLHIRFRLWNG